MLVIIEGPDGSGKTTLIAQEFTNRKFSVVHNGVYPSPDEAYRNYELQIGIVRNNRDANKLNIVHDRSYISQAVYGPIMRNEHIDWEAHEKIDRLVLAARGVIVYCRTDASMGNWRARLAKKGEYITDDKKYIAVCQGFDVILSRRTQVPVLIYDYLDPQNAQFPLFERIIDTRKEIYGL